jgi:glutamyl-tRNA reductase
MICYYIDHETYGGDAKTLARLSVKYKHANFIHPKKGISLLTCHRAEFYLYKQSKLFTKHAVQEFYFIRDTVRTYSRLFEIALGLHSQIIGENSIFQQVCQSANAYLYYSPNPILLKILRKAGETREKFGFYAPNHGQLIYEAFNKSKNSQTLILIGAGMLNYKILNSLKSVEPYSRIILITRDTKKAKAKYGDIHNIKFKSISEIDIQRIDKKFDVIIATNDITKEYVVSILQLCSIKHCINIADLSSMPIDGLDNLGKNYYSLFTENTKRLIEASNINMARKKYLVLDYLSHNNLNFL